MENHHFSWVNHLEMTIFNSYEGFPGNFPGDPMESLSAESDSEAGERNWCFPGTRGDVVGI